MVRRDRAFTLMQAAQESPSLARLTALTQESSARLQAILPLIPAGLRAHIQAGPIQDDSWCLLLANNASAAKLRQLLPTLLTCLRSKGWEVGTIRLKIQSGSARNMR